LAINQSSSHTSKRSARERYLPVRNLLPEKAIHILAYSSSDHMDAPPAIRNRQNGKILGNQRKEKKKKEEESS